MLLLILISTLGGKHEWSQMEFFPLLNLTTTVSGTVAKECEHYHNLLGPQTQIQTMKQNRPPYLF